jgi:hypothetical protein
MMRKIDWNLVASQLEISNGHAARMRFSRFRQHMEGTQTTPRNSRPKKNGSNSKSEKGCGIKAESKDSIKPMGESAEETPAQVKEEESARRDLPSLFGTISTIATTASGTISNPAGTAAITPPLIKPESDEEPLMSAMASGLPGPSVALYEPYQYPLTTIAPSELAFQNPALGFFAPAPPHNPFPAPQTQSYHHFWAPVKLDPNDGGCLDDIWVKMESQMDE